METNFFPKEQIEKIVSQITNEIKSLVYDDEIEDEIKDIVRVALLEQKEIK